MWGGDVAKWARFGHDLRLRPVPHPLTLPGDNPAMLHQIEEIVGKLNGILFSEYVVYALLFTGVLFTIWSVFGQYRALTHGVAVVRGKYDKKDDPGAINHFQALSTALSATVGLGNIAGVAVAVAIGGPGSILWMWVIGVVGMSLKMTEVTQSMLYRNTDDPENPHGGPMFVVKKGIENSLAGGKMLSMITGVVFAGVIVFCCLQWNPDIPFYKSIAFYLGTALGLVLVVMAFLNGAAMGSLIGGIFVITLIISAITGGNMFQAWNVADVTNTYFEVPQIVSGIILTVVVGAVIIGGIKRIGAVTGRLVPFMCVVYLLAALYVLALNLPEIPAMIGLIIKSGLPPALGGESANPEGAFIGGTFGFAAMWGIKRALFSSEAGQGSAPIAHSAAKTDEPVREGIVAGLEPFIDTLVVCTLTALVILSSGAYNRDAEAFFASADEITIVAAADADEDGNSDGWTLETPALPSKTDDAKRILRVTDGAGWTAGQNVFMLIQGEDNSQTGSNISRILGEVQGNNETGWTIAWDSVETEAEPTLVTREDGTVDIGIYGRYAGASLTAHAFDRVTPGLGMWLVTFAAWLFAVSTMISWNYYGEQGVVYLFARTSKSVSNKAVLFYKLIYCGLILVTTVGAMKVFGPEGAKKAMIGTDEQLDAWTTLGLGVMLVANIPLMLIFGSQAMKAYHTYGKKLKAGEFHPHVAPPFTEIVSGEDVESDD